jgi:hypothetical protein
MALEASAIALRDLSLLREQASKYGVDDWVETRYLSLGGIEE